MLRFALFADAHALHRKQRILRPAIALFANPHLLAPQVALNRVALRHLVVLEALRKTQPRAVAELANEREHLPFDVGGRPFGGIVEENLVLDLQPAQLLIEQTSVLPQWSQISPSQQLSVRGMGLARFPPDTKEMVRKYRKTSCQLSAVSYSVRPRSPKDCGSLNKNLADWFFT